MASALQQALALAKSKDDRAEALKAQAKAESNAHDRTKRKMLRWIETHLGPIIQHDNRFRHENEILFHGTKEICALRVAWTHYDRGMGEKEEMTWAYRIYVGKTHTEREQTFVTLLAEAVSEFLRKT